MILEKFLKFIRNQRLVETGDQVLLAVSGGADSTAMLHLFLAIKNQFGLALTIGHLNHGLRGVESDGDEEFVKELGRVLQVPVITRHLTSSHQATLAGNNLEGWARQQRYEFLDQAAESSGATKIALGHTMNDQAETVLMRLIRGSGPRGLAGMPAIRQGKYFRPMLWVSREDVLTYLRSNQLHWREDSSNQDVRFLRNRLRAELIPCLTKSYNPNIVQLLAHAAAGLREEVEALEELLQPIVKKESRMTGRQIVWEVSRLDKYPPAVRRQLIRHSLKQLQDVPGFVARQLVDSVVELALPGKSGKSIVMGRLRVVRDFDLLVIQALRNLAPK